MQEPYAPPEALAETLLRYDELTPPGAIDMVTHMKTTVDIADDLFLRAKREADASRTTLRSLIEQGLRDVLERRGRPEKTLVTPVTFRGNGLQPEFRDMAWNQIRDTIYGKFDP